MSSNETASEDIGNVVEQQRTLRTNRHFVECCLRQMDDQGVLDFPAAEVEFGDPINFVSRGLKNLWPEMEHHRGRAELASSYVGGVRGNDSRSRLEGSHLSAVRRQMNLDLGLFEFVFSVRPRPSPRRRK